MGKNYSLNNKFKDRKILLSKNNTDDLTELVSVIDALNYWAKIKPDREFITYIDNNFISQTLTYE